jgi:hypothetical protein
MVRLLLSFLACVVFVAAQSHPSWWNYASPNATALVGIDWQTMRATPFAEPIEAELWGDLGFPEIPALHHARQILISSPDLLALASGNFSVLTPKGTFKPMTYRGIDLWLAADKGILSFARLSDQLIILGEAKAIEIAIDRGMGDSKSYSPLLARGAKLGQKDFWVVSTQLPDDLASRFVPLDTEAQSFDGSLSVRDGLELSATLAVSSPRESAGKLRRALPMLPAILRGLEISAEEDSVSLALSATREQIAAALRTAEPAPPPPEMIRVETPAHVEQVTVELIPVEKPEPPKPAAKAPEKPLVIRIVGLDEGPREIVLPPAKVEKQNP